MYNILYYGIAMAFKGFFCAECAVRACPDFCVYICMYTLVVIYIYTRPSGKVTYICIVCVYIYIKSSERAYIRITRTRVWACVCGGVIVNGPLIYLHNLFCGAIHPRTIKRRKNVENLGYPMNYIDHAVCMYINVRVYVCVCMRERA